MKNTKYPDAAMRDGAGTLNDPYSQGTLLYRHGLYAEAIEFLTESSRQGDLVGQMSRYYQGMCHRALGIQALQDRLYQQGEEHFRQAMKLLGSQADLTSYLTSLYAQNGRYSACAAELDKAAQKNGSAAQWRKLAQSQWQAGQREHAYMTIAQAMRQCGGDAQLHLQQGMFCAAQEHFALAKASLARAAEADSTCVEAHWQLGLVAAKLNDLRLAVRSLQRAFCLRPGDVLLGYQLAAAARSAAGEGYHIVVQLPDVGNAVPAASQVQQLARFIVSESDFVEAFATLPPSEADEELFEVLLGVIQMALSEHPRYADLQFNAARVLDRLGRTNEAIEHSHMALEINPRYVKALVQMGKLLSRQGPAEEAAAYLHRAIAAGGDWPDVHCLSAQLMQRTNQLGAAREHLRRALQINSNYRPAAEALASLAA